MKFIETFAESNINVIEAFITLCMELIIFAKDSQFCQVKEVKNIVLNDNNIDLNKKNIILNIVIKNKIILYIIKIIEFIFIHF